MNTTIFLDLAKALNRLDLLGPLALGYVATDLFALALGLKRSSSLFKKIEQNPRLYPALHSLPGTRRKFFKLVEIVAWSKTALWPSKLKSDDQSEVKTATTKRLGRPRKSEGIAAACRGISVRQLRQEMEGSHE